ncbi:MAG: SGNH/GDSL hydrolase family protein [Bacteroidales bacterium]|nr:SGNH/GDSL hydrolase family protein [Bacteroidales bacterium]
MSTNIRSRFPQQPYFLYLALLFASLLLFTGYALMPNDIAFSFTLKKANIKNIAASHNTSPQNCAIITNDSCQKAAARQDFYALNGILDTSRQRFLLIGDSMGEYIRLRLNDYCRKNGHTMEAVIWYSSTTESYGTSDTLTHFINDFKPTYIIISLGSNELSAKNVKAIREPYIRHILEQIGDLPYIWIGPPNWKNDTGIDALIEENIGQGHYFDSRRLSFQRTKDHVHPARNSAYKWMDSIASYLYNDAAHRVIMEFPDRPAGKIPYTILLPANSKR